MCTESISDIKNKSFSRFLRKKDNFLIIPLKITNDGGKYLQRKKIGQLLYNIEPNLRNLIRQKKISIKDCLKNKLVYGF